MSPAVQASLPRLGSRPYELFYGKGGVWHSGHQQAKAGVLFEMIGTYPLFRTVLSVLRGTAARTLLILLGACAATSPKPGPASYAVADGASTRLGLLKADSLRQAPSDASWVSLLAKGREALAARVALADMAERSLDLQYYIWRDDLSGVLLADSLWRAAERGVRVRLLLDDWGERPSDAMLAALDAHAAIEVRLFNPVRWSRFRTLGMIVDFRRATRRMHNKAMIADNQFVILGGRNIGNEYFDNPADLNFGDLDVMAAGAVADQTSQGFDAYWNSSSVMALPKPAVGPAWDAIIGEWDTGLRRLHQSIAAFDLLGGGRSRTVTLARSTALYDAPRKADPEAQAHEETLAAQLRDVIGNEETLAAQLRDVIGNAAREVLIVSPYFIPGPAGVEAFGALRVRGIRVVIVTNALAATWAHAGGGKGNLTTG